MKDSRVCVIIPTYNRKARLLKAIDSVKAQSFPVEEIIVVDDGSEFSVEELLRERYGNTVTVITNVNNVGAAESRNIGVRSARGDFVAFLDSDDYWSPQKLEKQLSIFSAHPDVGLVYCDQWRVETDGSRKVSGKKLIKENIWNNLLEGWTAPNTSTLVFRSSVFLGLGGFDPQLSSCQDHDLWMRLAQARIPVDYTADRLSYFSANSASRISHNYQERLGGMEAFLLKWERPIIDSHGPRHGRKFRSDYVNRIAFSLVVHAIRTLELARAMSIMRRYLLFNRSFYRRLGKMLRRRLTPHQKGGSGKARGPVT